MPEPIQRLTPRNPAVASRMYAIWQRAYRVEADLLGATDFPPLRRTTTNLQACTNTFWGSFAGEKLVGVLEFVWPEVTILHIQSLVVDPEHFRQGHARRLVQHAVDQPGWTTLFVETGADNTPAIQLYERFGMMLTDRWMTNHGVEKVRLEMARREAP